MTRHRSNRHNKKSNVAEWLPAPQELTSGYRTLSYWMTVMVGLLSVGLLLQRFRGVMSENAAPLVSSSVMLSDDNRQLLYETQFLSLAPLLLSSAVTYQTGNSLVGVLSSLPFWFSRPVAAQNLGVSILVPEFLVNSNTTGLQWFPTVASVRAGEWIVFWHGGQTGRDDIYAQRYATNGSMLGSEFVVNNNTVNDQRNPAVATLSAGEWVVVWEGYQAGSSDIYAQRFGANGGVVGSEFRVNSNTTGGQRNPAVASSSTGEWAVVWQGDQTGNGDIYAQRFGANGNMLGSEFRVNSNTTRQQQNPVVASVSAEEWVVVWSGDQAGDADVYGQRFAGNGTVLGSQFRVNSNTTNIQDHPALASVSGGEWVVVWDGYQAGGNDIYAQRFGANGVVVGSEFRVNSYTAGQQYYPSVASLDTGEWVVVWQTLQSTNMDIHGQRFARNSSVLGAEFQVNSNVTDYRHSPAVAGLSTGVWFVVWAGQRTDNYDVYASIFSTTEPLSPRTLPTPSISSTMSTTVGSTATTPASSTTSRSSVPGTSTVDPSIMKSTLPSPASITSPIMQPSLTSAGIPPIVTTGTEQTTTTSVEQAVTTNVSSGVSGAVIGAAVGGSVVGVVACLGAIGFYAYRKKSCAAQASPSAISEAEGISLKPTEYALAQQPSGYVQMNLKQGNQSDNRLPVSHSPYGRIDEMKKQEKEYDHAPRF